METYLRIVKDEDKSKDKKTDVFGVFSQMHGYHLGEVRWYAPWRRYCFYPALLSILDVNCLGEVIKFIQTQMKLRKIT